jgi:OmpA-OmpF porin, OOP family
MIILQHVRFAPQSAVPPPDSRPILDEAAKVLMANPQITLLRVEGHADANERQPDVIAKRRADEAVAYLIAKGVPPDRLVAAGEGAKKPIADNATAEGRAQNRRIEFHIVP